MNVPNADKKIFADLEPEEQQAIISAPWEHVEKLSRDNTWTPTKNWYYLPGEICRYIAPKPQWVDIAPSLRNTNLWKVTTPDHSSLLLTSAPAHAGFIGFVYGAIVCAQLQYEGNSVNPTEPTVKIPDAVRFRQ